jgi:hypothetical protein
VVVEPDDCASLQKVSAWKAVVATKTKNIGLIEVPYYKKFAKIILILFSTIMMNSD